MTAARRARGRAAVVGPVLLGAVVSALLLTGCGNEAAGSAPEVPAALTETPGELPRTPGERTPVLPATESGTPTLPPGDPGTDSPAPPRGEDHEHEPRTDVPANALLDAQTLTAVLGQPWRAAAAPRDTCATPRPGASLATRTAAHSSTSGHLVETVSVHRTEEVAEQAVAALASRLRACGWTPEEAPPIGEASVQLQRRTTTGTERVVAVAVEGVSVTLTAAGRAFESADTLTGVVDIAVSSSCAAAADGCH